jgi:serine/threonine protein phosphatase 1
VPTDGVERDWRSLYVVADVHGERGRLAAALEALDDRPVVLVGDYVDRGSDTRGTLELLADVTRRRDDVVCLRGNHENRLIEFLRDGSVAFPGGGAAETVRSYLPAAAVYLTPGELPATVWTEFRAGFPAEHLDLLTAMPLWLETPDVFVSHAGPNPEAPDQRTAAALTLGGPERFERATSAPFAKTVVCGHYIQRSGVPWVGERFIAIDLGCGTFTERPLAVLHWPERTVRTF